MNVLRIATLLAISFALIISLWRPGETGGLMASLEGRTLDMRFLVRGERPPPENIAILAIDDATLSTLDAFPPPRDALADAVTTAREKGARTIAFDLLLSGKGLGDDALVEALQQKADVTLAVSLSSTLGIETDPALQEAIARSALSLVIGAPSLDPSGRLGPAPYFAAHTNLGHVNITRETDGALRRMLLANSASNMLILPALPLEAVRRYAGLGRSQVSLTWGKALRIDGKSLALDRHNEVGLNYYGPRGTIPTYSLIDAQSADLKDRMVFIGATAEGFGDTFPSPYDRDMFGVEALATMAANITEGTTLRRDNMTWSLDVLLALIAAVAAVYAASRARPARAVILTLIVWVGLFALLQAAFVHSLWLDGASLLLSLSVATFAGGAGRWVMHRNHARNLAQYQSPLLADVLADRSHPLFDGRIQKAAALFIDATDFTARANRLGPARTTQFLKAFHGCVERAASANGGVVEQYAGDGAMICFGLPEATPDDACNALKCTTQLFAEIESLSASETQSGEEIVSIRVGAHFGDVSAAVLGGENHSHITFVGDVINSASRLQEVAKELKAELVISNDLAEACGTIDPYELVWHGPKALRGRDTPLEIWFRPQQKLPE